MLYDVCKSDAYDADSKNTDRFATSLSVVCVVVFVCFT